MARPLLVSFAAGALGPWRIEKLDKVVGKSLPPADRMTMIEGPTAGDPVTAAMWRLLGTTSNERYVEVSERASLAAVQAPLGRPEATCAALIPIRKSEAWWELAQDERRAILEARSRHIAVGLEYLPAVARRLHHSRELGQEFDFLTWFEFPPEAAGGFEELVTRLRDTEEWRFVDREVDIRMRR